MATLAQLADRARLKSGNFFQKEAGAIGNIGTALHLPEWGVSERFGTPTAQFADTSAYETGAGGAYPQKPAGYVGPNPVPPQQTAGGGTGGGTAQVLGFATLSNGRIYNLDDPTEKQAFFNDKLGLLTQARDAEIAKGKSTSDANIAAIDQHIQDTYSAAKAYVQDYNKNVNEFGHQYQLGNVKRGQYYAQASPNAFQSSQGDSQLYAEGKYLQGIGDMAQTAQGNVGSGFMANPNDISQISAGSTFGRSLGQMNNQKVDTANAFNDFLASSQQDVQNQAADLSGSLSGTKAFSYNPSAIAVPTANKADVSAYTPYTSFQQGNVQVPLTANNTVYQPNAFTSQTPLDSFLGKNQLDTRQKDYLQSWLMGKAA